ncbi:clavesin-2 isoform X2 [Anabrus simplex]|uniref:clavesin-2 isoform X2 n=1 Tax=Anabrus simplex TaxID=316456 RepID=UPI0034DDB844
MLLELALLMGRGQDLFCGEDDGYQCNLSEELKKVAQAELREDEATRRHALAQMRDWIAKHPHIRKCRTDSPFLLRFLRTKKFSVPLAQEMLERYLTIRQLYPHWFRNLNVDDPILNEILDQGYLVPLPQRDEFGRQVILSCAGRFDPYKYTSAHMARCHSLVVESLMDDDENQIRGYSYVNDESGLLMGHISLWSLSDIRAMLRCIQNSTPMRHKATHFMNVPHYANKVFEFFIGLLNDKLKNRIMLHSNMEDLKEAVDPKILPKEYGGEVPMADMIAQFKETLHKKQEAIKALDEMEIELDRKSQFITDMEDELIGVAGSFRKLEVD